MVGVNTVVAIFAICVIAVVGFAWTFVVYEITENEKVLLRIFSIVSPIVFLLLVIVAILRIIGVV